MNSYGMYLQNQEITHFESLHETPLMFVWIINLFMRDLLKTWFSYYINVHESWLINKQTRCVVELSLHTSNNPFEY